MEQELIRGCVKNDSASQKKLFDTYAGKFMTIAKRYMKEDMLAEDVLMEGFYKIYTNIKSFKGDGSFEGWMKRIFINTALEFYRVNKNHMYHSDVDVAYSQPHHDFTVERMSQKEIMEAMNNLAPGYRTVLNLFVIEGYSHAEIAEMLGISEGTSKSQLNRARTLLKEYMTNKAND